MTDAAATSERNRLANSCALTGVALGTCACSNQVSGRLSTDSRAGEGQGVKDWLLRTLASRSAATPGLGPAQTNQEADVGSLVLVGLSRRTIGHAHELQRLAFVGKWHRGIW